MDFIDLKEQYRRCQAAVHERIDKVLAHGQYVLGPEIAEIESVLANYVGVKHCITVASGTDSLEIALRALRIGPGDEVITVPFTWISTAEVIALVGARPVFVDIEADTYNLDVERLEEAITAQTKAILPVSLFGQMPDYDRINAIARKHNLPVIEDAAQSFGASQRGRRSGGVTLIGSTSFFPAKPLGCYGEGGALFTNDDALAGSMRAIRTHGGVQRHQHTVLGMNGRFDTLQAAILLAKFPQFEWEVEQRARIGARYSALLLGEKPGHRISKAEGMAPVSDLRSSLSGSRLPCAPPVVAPGNTHVYAQYTIRIPDRNQVAQRLQERGIPSGVYYPKCLHEQPVFKACGYQLGDFPVAEKASREVLSLPMHAYLTEADQDCVVAAVLDATGPGSAA
jgi:UDP-2-acetamido-2-deoxy-ribo-hexuluronate aminotransferase